MARKQVSANISALTAMKSHVLTASIGLPFKSFHRILVLMRYSFLQFPDCFYGIDRQRNDAQQHPGGHDDGGCSPANANLKPIS